MGNSLVVSHGVKYSLPLWLGYLPQRNESICLHKELIQKYSQLHYSEQPNTGNNPNAHQQQKGQHPMGYWSNGTMTKMNLMDMMLSKRWVDTLCFHLCKVQGQAKLTSRDRNKRAVTSGRDGGWLERTRKEHCVAVVTTGGDSVPERTFSIVRKHFTLVVVF